MACLVAFIMYVTPEIPKTPSYHFNRLVCIFWTGRFFYWIFIVIAFQFFFFFAVYHLLDVTGADHYKMISEEYQIPTYSTTITVFSVFITLPQAFAENIVGDECNCSNRKMKMPYLSLAYAQVYDWIAILIFDLLFGDVQRVEETCMGAGTDRSMLYVTYWEHKYELKGPYLRFTGILQLLDAAVRSPAPSNFRLISGSYTTF
ncbi:unnamed protein product [Dibothriocephalus latus]|uniref:Uncharacterized protein n=1 Tax=Dibothriocephalus latus TaxID=60516 RepID=A0A3P7NX76_DIBLA|nr:unnamed protein product [Dibothriocephalus latus]